MNRFNKYAVERVYEICKGDSFHYPLFMPIFDFFIVPYGMIYLFIIKIKNKKKGLER